MVFWLETGTSSQWGYMFRTFRPCRWIPVLVLATLALPLQAQVVKVRDFKLNTPQDRRILFDVAATPSGDVLSFIAKNTGEWQLHRVRNWLSESPGEEKLLLPGYFSKTDQKDLELLTAGVFVSRDGAYAVCVGSAEWLKRIRGRAVGNARSDDVISVVDLATFKIVATVRTRALDLYEFHGVTLDDDGYVRVSSLSSGKLKHDAFIRLSVPSLQPAPRCTYDWSTDAGKLRVESTADRRCLESLKPKTLEEYIDEKRPSSIHEPIACENNGADFCRLPDQRFTSDGKFGVADSDEGHDNLFGSYVTTRSSYVIFSTSKRADVGEIKLPTDDLAKSMLIALAGRDYLVVVRDGTLFGVYELRD
jgi:hypothetical protein